MSGNYRNLAPDEIERALEHLFGFTDGTRSEDEQEDSDVEDLGPSPSAGDFDPNNSSIFPELAAPNLLSTLEPLSPQPGPSNNHTHVRIPSVPRPESPPQQDEFQQQQETYGGVIIEDTDLDDSDCDESEWKKGAWPQDPYLAFFDAETIAPACDMSNRSNPLSYFELFFDSEAIDIIVTETNRFASQHGDLNWAPVSEMEIKALLGMIVQMGIHKLPSFEDYWSTDPLLHVVEIAKTMTLKKFQKIMKYLHLNDNRNMPGRDDENYDKLYKVRPLLEHINRKCQTAAISTNSQSIDESMVNFKGRSTLKQYMPMKPIKRGFKIWARADSHTGYLYQFQVYTGKSDNVESGLGSKVIKTLCQPLIEDNYMGHVAFDNFFSSPALLQDLYDKGVYATATVRNDRQDMPVLVKKPKLTGNRQTDARIAEAVKEANRKTKRMKRGEWKWRIKLNVGFVIRKDNKLVSILSTAFHPKEKRMCDRTQNDGSKKSFACPMAVVQYTKRMGGVDRFDQKKTPYSIGRKSSKWWKRLFYFFIDTAITNAYILYASNRRTNETLSQKAFRLALSRELVANKTFRKRPFASMPRFRKKSKPEPENRQKLIYGVPEPIRFADLGQHWPEELPSFRRCRKCSNATNNKRSRIQCEKCRVPLCAFPCFKDYHKKPQ